MSENPFHIEGPALVSFSGGRTSAYMLRRILDEGLQPDVHVVFADTGKERAETYEFVRACAERWGVEIHWVQRAGGFDQLLKDRGFLPNPVFRFCTTELKIRPMRDWMRARGYEHWTNVVGLRADEPRRVANMRANRSRERWDVALPLVEAGITESDVLAFWREQPFDLQLQTWEGNCDLCFLKSRKKRLRIMQDRPDLAAWWIEKETTAGDQFRRGEPSYQRLFMQAQGQMSLFAESAEDGDDLQACYCND